MASKSVTIELEKGEASTTANCQKGKKGSIFRKGTLAIHSFELKK